MEKLVNSIVKGKEKTLAVWGLTLSLQAADFYSESLYPTVVLKGFEGLSKEQIVQKLKLNAWQEFVDKMERTSGKK